MLESKKISRDLDLIKFKSPVIHNITNYVVANFTANALLAIGASPIMSHAEEEMRDIVTLSEALVLNIGTLDAGLVGSMLSAQTHAKSKNIPIILDPVGAAASNFRVRTTHTLLKKGVSVIKGNASEIMAIADQNTKSKGIDSKHNSVLGLQAAKQISKAYKCIVIISGDEDYVVKENKHLKLKNGHTIMQRVTGMGCTCTAILGAFLAINQNFFIASAHAMSVVALAGEQAAKVATSPGKFIHRFLDQLYLIDSKVISGLKYE